VHNRLLDLLKGFLHRVDLGIKILRRSEAADIEESFAFSMLGAG
jgi:hypothetical protein